MSAPTVALAVLDSQGRLASHGASWTDDDLATPLRPLLAPGAPYLASLGPLAEDLVDLPALARVVTGPDAHFEARYTWKGRGFRLVASRVADSVHLVHEVLPGFRYQQLFDSPMLGLLFWNEQGDVVEANDAFLKMVGYTRQELEEGRIRWRDLTPPEYAEVEAQALAEVQEFGWCAPFEKEYFRKDGSRIPIVIGGGLLEGMRGGASFVVNASARKNLAQALQESQEFMTSLLECTPTPIHVVGMDGRFRMVNRAGEVMSGVPRMELVGRRLEDLFPPEAVEVMLSSHRAVLEAGRPIVCEEVLTSAQGTKVTFQTVKFPLRRPDGTIDAVGGISLDYTELRAARDLAQLLASIVEWSDDAIFSTDIQGCILTWNAGAERLLGYPAHEAVGRNPMFLVAEGQEAWVTDLRSRVREGQTVAGTETVLRRRDGLPVPVSLTVSGVRASDRGLAGFSVIARDVTLRNRLQEQLLQAHKLDAVGRLAGGVAHDYNNATWVILGYCDLLLAEPDLPFRHEVQQIHKAARRAEVLTRQLLAYSRQSTFEMESLDLNELVGDTDRLIRRLVGRHIRLELALAPDLLPLRGDRNQLGRVLLNLAMNAIDAMQEKGGELVVETRNATLSDTDVAGLPAGSYVEMRVRDTGPGIPEELQPYLFEPFFTTKEPGKGTGLGLATVYGIVTQSGGAVLVDSRLNVGTEFRVLLPANPTAPRKGEAPAPAQQDPAQRL